MKSPGQWNGSSVRLQKGVDMQRHLVESRIDQRQLRKRFWFGPSVRSAVADRVVDRTARHLGN